MKKICLLLISMLICMCAYTQDALLDSAQLAKFSENSFRSYSGLKLIDNCCPAGVTGLYMSSGDQGELKFEKIHLFTKLQVLHISGYYKLDISIPKEIGLLKNLQVLKIENNKSISLPKEIEALQNLRLLDLSHNKLTSLPNGIETLGNLEILNLSNNKLTSLPKEIGKLKKLKVLKLSNNMLNSLPEEIMELENLEVLELGRNLFIKVPEGIWKLKKIRVIDLSGNNNLALTDNFGKLKTLQELYFYAIYDDFANTPRPIKIPKSIGDLDNLKILGISHNNLTIVPKEIWSLKNLKKLYLNDNKLTSIPKEIANLKNLENLDISNNKIKFLPKEIETLPKIKVIETEGNLFKKKFLAHDELRSALYDGRYKDALKYISQGADIRKARDTMESVSVNRIGKTVPNYVRENSGSSPRVGAFIGFLLPFVAAAEGLSQKSGSNNSPVNCKIVDIALNDALGDTIKSPERLKVMEYALQKGATPDDLRLYLAVENRDVEATRLLMQYKAEADSDWFWKWTLPTCQCLDSTDKNKYNPERFASFKQVVGVVLKNKPKLSDVTLERFYTSPVLTKMLLEFYTPEELHTIHNPLYTACGYFDLELFKEYEALGFSKFDIYKNEKFYKYLGGNSRWAKIYEYIYPKGFDVNFKIPPYNQFEREKTFFCRIIEYSTIDVDVMKTLLTMKPDFCVPCNPLGVLQKRIAWCKRLLDSEKNSKYYNEDLNRYKKSLAIEPLLEEYYKTLPKEQKKIILKSLKKYQTSEYDLSVFLKKTYIKKLKKL